MDTNAVAPVNLDYSSPELVEFGTWDNLTLESAPSEMRVNKKTSLLEPDNEHPLI